MYRLIYNYKFFECGKVLNLKNGKEVPKKGGYNLFEN